MKIVLFGPTPPLRGGVPLFTAALARELTKARHDVHIVGFAKLFPEILFPGKSQLDETAKPFSAQRVGIPWKWRTWKIAARMIAELKPDVIAAMWWLPAFGFGYRVLIRSLPLGLQQKFVTIIHDVVSHERFPGDAWLSRHALKCSPRFLVLSRAEGRRLQKLLPELTPEQVAFAPHPLYNDVPPFAGSVEEARGQMGVTAPRVLLFFGFVRKYKGLDVLLRALPEIRRQCGDVQLLICGPFHERRTRYDDIIARLGLAQHVVLHERYFTGENVAPCFAAADAVVLPYLSATQTGVAPMAFALGTPVLATPVGGLAEVVDDGETGYLFEPDSPRSLANAVKEFYHRGGKPACAEAIRRVMNESSWDKFIQALTT